MAAGIADLQTDLPRLRAGGVGAQFWSVYVPHSPAAPAAVATVLETLRNAPVLAEVARNVADVAPDAHVFNYTNPAPTEAHGDARRPHRR